MSAKDYFGGTVTKGVVTFDDPVRWRAVLARHEGRRVTITARREQQQRSLAQNRYYWSMVIPLFSEWSGYERDEAHEVLKSLFLKEQKVLPSGEEITVAGSTARLSKEQFTEYVERVARWLAEQGVYVPPPGQRVEASL